MSYTLQAIIGPIDLRDESTGALGPGIELRDGLTMIPLTNAIRERFAIPFLQFDHEGTLPRSLESVCQDLSRGRLIAHIEASFFGGNGIQANAVFENEALVGSPVIAPNAINQALRLFGVKAVGCFDEFAAVGLGRHGQSFNASMQRRLKIRLGVSIFRAPWGAGRWRI